MVVFLNNVFPVFLIIALGTVLKRIGITTDSYLKASDRLVYFIFFPVLLFWKIGGAESSVTIRGGLTAAILLAITIIFLLTLLCIRILKLSDYQVGSFSPCCYRFNTYIGMAIILNSFGENGVQHFGVIISIAIPYVNILAVATLIWFSSKSYSSQEKTLILLKALFTNPLILACIVGILYSKIINEPFPVYLDKSFWLISVPTLPLALLSIGGSLTFDKLKTSFTPAMASSVFKLFLLPLAGYVCMRWLGVTGAPFQVAMVFFALPTSTANYILSSQLQGDVDLVSASIILTTLLSFVSLSTVMVMFGA